MGWKHQKQSSENILFHWLNHYVTQEAHSLVRQAGPDYKALDSQSCFIRLGGMRCVGSVDPWVMTISEQLETCHSVACPNFSPSLTPPAAKEALPSGQQPVRQSTRRHRVGLNLLTSARLGFFPTATSYWCPFWKSAFSPSASNPAWNTLCGIIVITTTYLHSPFIAVYLDHWGFCSWITSRITFIGNTRCWKMAAEVLVVAIAKSYMYM